MKSIIVGFCMVFAVIFNVEACPYQKMAEVESKINSNMTKIDANILKEISDLKIESKKKLQIGELDNAEKILDKALALIN